MPSNCCQCKYFDHHPNHHGDIRCANSPAYAAMWLKISSLDESTLNALPIDFCRDFELNPSLEKKEIQFSLTFAQWRKWLTSEKMVVSAEYGELSNSIADKNVEISLSLTFSQLTHLAFYRHRADQLPLSLRDFIIEKSISFTLEEWQAIANNSNHPQVLDALKQQGIEPHEEEERWHEVDSSCIDAIAHHRPSSRLTIRFNSREVYEYSDVASDTFQDFLDADSKGRFFNMYIKNEYSCNQIGFALA